MDVEDNIAELIPELLADHETIETPVFNTNPYAVKGRIHYILSMPRRFHQVVVGDFKRLSKGEVFACSFEMKVSFFHPVERIFAFQVYMGKIPVGEHITGMGSPHQGFLGICL